MGNLLGIEGFRFRGAEQSFLLAKREGSFTVPAGTTVGFALHATSPLAVTVREDGEPTLQHRMNPDESLEHVVRATRDVRVEIDAGGQRRTLSLESLAFH